MACPRAFAPRIRAFLRISARAFPPPLHSWPVPTHFRAFLPNASVRFHLMHLGRKRGFGRIASQDFLKHLIAALQRSESSTE